MLGLLCEMLATGCFPFTDDPEDVRYSDYRDAFGDVIDAAGAAMRKLENEENGVLRPFQKLRGYEQE